MPWKTQDIMSIREEFVVLASRADANRRELCRRFGISPQTGYTWLQRYAALGREGLADQSRRPLTSPARTEATFEQAVVEAFKAGSDMILICATPELMRRGYHALTQAIANGAISENRVQASLAHIAAVKARTQPPLPFDATRLQQLSGEIAALNQKLNYSYGR